MKKYKNIIRLVTYFMGVFIYILSLSLADIKDQLYIIGAGLGTLMFSCAMFYK